MMNGKELLGHSMHSRFIGSSSGPAPTPTGAIRPQKLLYTLVAQQASRAYMYTFFKGAPLLSDRSHIVSATWNVSEKILGVPFL